MFLHIFRKFADQNHTHKVNVNNPHDRYFKEIFSGKSEASAFLKGSLSPELVKNIDFDSLKPLKDTFIDEELAENFSDLLYTVKYKGKTKIQIALLFEHKSSPVEYPHFQLLKYMLKIWEAGIKEKKTPVPVIPIVFYHGKKKWNQKRFENYFEGIDNNISRFLPSFEYFLNDLSKQSDEEIVKKYHEIKVRTALLLMKNIFDEARLKDRIPFIFYGTRKIENTETGEKFFTATIYYLFNFVEKIENITEAIKTSSPKGGKIAMTIATQLEQKGLQRGLQKGLYEGRKESVIKLFKKAGLTIDQIVEYLELDRKFVVKILKEANLID